VKNCRQVAADIVELISREEKKGVVGGVQNRLPRCVCWQASPSAEPDIPFHFIWLVPAGITSSNSSSPVRHNLPNVSQSSHTASTGDAGVGKSSLLIRLTDQRFLANPDPTVRILSTSDPVYSCLHNKKLGVEFGSKLITIPDQDNKVVKLQCAYQLSHSFLAVLHIPPSALRLVVRKETPSSDCVLLTCTNARMQAGTPPEPNPSAPSPVRTTAVPQAAYSSTM